MCILNQWALDFMENTRRILKSIREAKLAGARYRLGPELEISSYGCEDHFLEDDTYTHTWSCLAEILSATASDHAAFGDIVCDIGAPVMYNGDRYNCRVVILNGTILLIRPKLTLANDGLHRETRWFTPWTSPWHLERLNLPQVIQAVGGQQSAPFGCTMLLFDTQTVTVGLETCEELWKSNIHEIYYAAGAHIIFNASASHHELRKLSSRLELIRKASNAGGGGIYAYSNLVGCDANRACYDGGAIVATRGEFICIGERFGLAEVAVHTVSVDLPCRAANTVPKTYRKYTKHCLEVDFNLLRRTKAPLRTIWHPMETPEEEISRGPALWLWDMLRRSGAGGFFLCLSGGLDSSSVACIVYSMCRQVKRVLIWFTTARSSVLIVDVCPVRF